MLSTIRTTKDNRINITATCEATVVEFKKNGWYLFTLADILCEIESQGCDEINMSQVRNRISQFAKLSQTGLINCGNGWYEWSHS